MRGLTDPCCTAGRRRDTHDGDSSAPMRKRAKPNHDEVSAKMMVIAPPAGISNPEPRLLLRKQLRWEMEELRGLLKKAEILVGKVANGGAAPPPPSRGKDGHFLATEARTEADRTTCAKKRRTVPPAEIVEPRMSEDDIFSLASLVSSLSANMPTHIIEFLRKQSVGDADGDGGEFEIDLGSMKHSALFELRKLLGDFAEQKKQEANASGPVRRTSPRQQEDGELAEEDNDDVFVDICGDAAPVSAHKVLCSSRCLREEGEVQV